MARLAEPILGTLLGLSDVYKEKWTKERERKDADAQRLRDIDSKRAEEAETYKLGQERSTAERARKRPAIRAILGEKYRDASDDVIDAFADNAELLKITVEPAAKAAAELPIVTQRGADNRAVASTNSQGRINAAEIAAGATRYNADSRLRGNEITAGASMGTALLGADTKQFDTVIDANTAVMKDETVRREGAKNRANKLQLKGIDRGIKAGSDKTVIDAANINANSRRDVAATQAGGRVDAAKISAEAKVGAAVAKATERINKMTREQLTNPGASTAAIREARAWYKENSYNMTEAEQDAMEDRINAAIMNRLSMSAGGQSGPTESVSETDPSDSLLKEILDLSKDFK